jgi:metal-responsive CopG/Arc/MetJ family transcriptional regulator
MKNKITKTYSISNKLYEEFEKITKEKNINKSSLIETWIKDFIKKETN